MAIFGLCLCLVGVVLILVRVNDGPTLHLPWVVWGFTCILMGVLCLISKVL
jgi:hypothetical protein